jgi:hypothetical protein
VLGLAGLGRGNWPDFNAPDLVREWRDELIRRGFSPRSEKWDLKLVAVTTGGRAGETGGCAIYSHGSDMVDYTDLRRDPSEIDIGSPQRLRYGIRRAGERCDEPTPEEREERRKAILEHRIYTERRCREGKTPPRGCKHLSD